MWRTVAVLVVTLSLAMGLGALPARASSGNGAHVYSSCIAHRPLEVPGVLDPYYTSGCSGHDEPELDPISSAPGSAQNLTWTVLLPGDGSVLVSTVGPTFWFGGAVLDPSSFLGQAFVELQFYPDAIVTKCASDGGFQLQFSPNDFSVCSPVWKVSPNGHTEKAAFNAMLTDGSSSRPLVMHAGDLITVHWYVTPRADGFHVTVSDLSTGRSGTIVLDSRSDGPLMPAYSTQSVGNALPWGLVNDTPNSFVWEIGHTSDFATPSGRFCLPGDSACASYNAASWAGTMPIVIESVTFGDGSFAKHWAVVSDFGGEAEVNRYCPVYGAPFCVYPWFTLGHSGFHYGVDYNDTLKDYNQGAQFQQALRCGGPFGPNSTYCDTVIT